jgi:hypothetical protein
MALIIANISSHSDPAQRQYGPFQRAITGSYFEMRDPIAFRFRKAVGLFLAHKLKVEPSYMYDVVQGPICSN